MSKGTDAQGGDRDTRWMPEPVAASDVVERMEQLRHSKPGTLPVAIDGAAEQARALRCCLARTDIQPV
jgi:hypothetical protein